MRDGARSSKSHFTEDDDGVMDGGVCILSILCSGFCFSACMEFKYLQQLELCCVLVQDRLSKKRISG